jgi:glycosyltransferase involved in cell wall biosynthesis
VTGSLPIAFYAPLKSPNHPAPSGDRTMARLLVKALVAAGFEPTLASELRTLDRIGTEKEQDRLRAESATEAEHLIDRYRALPAAGRPLLWFTYHVYYKAPDWIGPAVSDALGIPYCVAEGSRAAKRASGPWALGHAGAEAALDRADAVFVMTAHDREALERLRSPKQILIDLPPFLDLDNWAVSPAHVSANREPRLLTVAMMREGDKLASYRILAEALGHLQHQPWSLDMVGNGEARPAVEAEFRRFGDRIRFHGQVETGPALRALYAQADLFVWPAVNEAYGMVLLEAQALGCPVVAGAYGGVPTVVRHGQTGLLTTPGDPCALAVAVKTLLVDPQERMRIAMAARRFVAEERSLKDAAARLRNALMPLLGQA